MNRAQFIQRRMAGQQHQRATRKRVRYTARHAVGVSGATGEHDDAGLAGQPRPGVGHVHGCAFVTHMGDGEFRLRSPRRRPA